MRLFPYTINRISGSTIDHWNKFDFTAINNLSDSIIESERELAISKVSLISALEKLIGNTQDEKVKKLLINCKRSVFNDRQGDLLTLSGQLSEIINAGTNGLFSLYQKQILDQEGRLSKLGSVYSKDVEGNQKVLYDLIGIEAFQSGLVLSSHSLLNQIKSLSKDKLQPKKRIEIEVGALKFLTRIFTKTTPYSTFTNLSYGNLNSDNQVATGEVKSHLYTNNRVLSYFFNLLESYQPVYNKLQVKLNPSLHRQGENLSFLVSHYSIQSIQSIKGNALLEWLVSELSTRSINYEDLRTEVLELVDDLSREKTDLFLRQLVKIGFLKVNVPIPGLTHDWEEKLFRFLNGLGLDHDPQIQSLIELLQIIQNCKRDYPSASQEKRMSMLQFTLNEIERITEFISLKCEQSKEGEGGKDSGKQVFTYGNGKSLGINVEKLFFEDTTIDADTSKYNSFIKQEVPKIQALINELHRVSLVNKEREVIKRIYKSTYTNKKGVPLLEFFKHYRQEATKLQEADLQFKDGSSEWCEKMKPLFSYNEASDSVINISIERIKENNDSLQLPDKVLSDKQFSYGAYIQCYEKDGKPCLVLNSVAAGFGRLIGRFLHLFPSEITTLLQEWNSTYSTTKTGTEINDTSFFNANIQPNLMPYQVSIDLAYSNYPSENQISLSEIELRYDKSADELFLISKGKRISTFNLGLQFELGRAPLISFLQNFSEQMSARIAILQDCYPSIKVMGNSTFTPRVVLDSSIVLSRAKWKINKSDLPVQLNNESNHEFFLKVNSWRIKHKIPEKVFIKTNVGFKNISKGGSKDEIKPQFLDFSNPMMVNLFAKQCKKVTYEMQFEEMLPAIEEMNHIGTQRHAIEQIVTWYSN